MTGVVVAGVIDWYSAHFSGDAVAVGLLAVILEVFP